MDGMGGFATALGEITLVLFTTLAPSGAIALALMGLPIVAGAARTNAGASTSSSASLWSFLWWGS